MRNPLRPAKSDNGYGEPDRKLADDLRSASTADEADKIARDSGLTDAADAVSWLQERSS